MRITDKIANEVLILTA